MDFVCVARILAGKTIHDVSGVSKSKSTGLPKTIEVGLDPNWPSMLVLNSLLPTDTPKHDILK